MVERVYIVSKGVNEQNSTLPPTLIVQEREVKPKSYKWKWGFQGKTGWDWANLLFVPLALGLLTLFVNDEAKNREQYALEERNSQEVVQDYLSKLNGAILKGAKLRDANLANAHLNNIDLTDADLTGADIGTAEIETAILCKTTMPEGTVDSSKCPGQAQ